jgi:excisionase family DNA binding protein
MTTTDRKDPDLITVDELADWLRWSRWTTYRSYERLGLPYLRVGGSVRFRVGSVRAWLVAQESSHPEGQSA